MKTSIYDHNELFNNCHLCSERDYATRPVPGTGPLDAKIAILGRNPGAIEDREGRGFIGRAGRKLDQGLIFANLTRRECWITNTVKCLTPPNRVPSLICQSICTRQWLGPELAQLEKLQLLIVLGNEALRYIEPKAFISDVIGTTWKMIAPWNGAPISIFANFHPSAALRSIHRNRQFLDAFTNLEKLLVERGMHQ
jgi:DNA polymerase